MEGLERISKSSLTGEWSDDRVLETLVVQLLGIFGIKILRISGRL